MSKELSEVGLSSERKTLVSAMWPKGAGANPELPGVPWLLYLEEAPWLAQTYSSWERKGRSP